MDVQAHYMGSVVPDESVSPAMVHCFLPCPGWAMEGRSPTCGPMGHPRGSLLLAATLHLMTWIGVVFAGFVSF